MTDDKATQRIVDGTSWREFCERLKSAGDPIFGKDAPSDALSRAEGTRYLTRLTRAALETFVEFADPMAPVLRRTVHETIKMGADNPDNWYENAPVHGDYEYRLHGTRGSVPYLSLATQQGHYGQGRGMPPAGFIEAKDLTVDADGRVELVLSKHEKPGNWLKLPDADGTLIVRQTFLDRSREMRAELTLERIGAATKPAPLPIVAAELDRGLQSAASLVSACAMIFPSWAHGFKKHANQLPQFDPNLSRMFGGDPNIAYYHSYWELAPDEALLIHATPPDCEYWNFQLNNYWMESLDYRHYEVCINKAGAELNEDGSVRVVIAHQNPGLANWLSTAGHAFGTMCWRWVRADHHPQPSTRVVKVAELAELAP